MAKKTKSKFIKLDIACGQNKQEGFIGMDIAKCKGVDIVQNVLHYPWPIESGSVEEAFCSHFIEHIPFAYWNKGNKYSLVPESNQSVEAFCKFFEEVYRVLKSGGSIKLIAPYYSSMRAWQDPTHRRAICDASFFYLSKKWREEQRLDHYNLTCDFDCVGGYAFDPTWSVKNQETQMFAARHHINVVNDIWLTLTKK